MALYEQIVAIYPELHEKLHDHIFWSQTIVLQDDSDGEGAYIKKWDYEKPIPDGLKLGK